MAVFQANTDRKKISILLNLIKFDCKDVYKKFRTNKIQLKHAIELYEVFMTNEINELFLCNNNFSDIVLSHRKKFENFIENTFQPILDAMSSKGNDNFNNDIYVLFISLQEWYIQGPKGQQFYFMIDIDSFNFTQLKSRPFSMTSRKVNK